MSWYRTHGSGAFCWHENNCPAEPYDFSYRGESLREGGLPLGRTVPYIIFASGPTRVVLPGDALLMYDSSNGTMSDGNIIRLGP